MEEVGDDGKRDEAEKFPEFHCISQGGWVRSRVARATLNDTKFFCEVAVTHNTEHVVDFGIRKVVRTRDDELKKVNQQSGSRKIRGARGERSDLF